MQKNLIYTVSARGKKERKPIIDFLNENFPSLPLSKIDSVFGFVEPSTLYSGRPFLERQISENDIQVLKDNNIGLRIPFTNHYCSREEYEQNKVLLEKYHEKGNSVITANVDLANWIKQDFPNYQLEASILKEIKTQEEVDDALELYDTVVLPMNANYRLDFLRSLKQKDKITLFGNAGCALTCPNRICYEYLSRQNKKLASKGRILRYIHFFFYIGLSDKWCMHRIKPRELRGLINFDIKALSDLGFSRFKMLRENPELLSGH